MTESPESIILRQIREENAPVKAVEFRQWVERFDTAIAHLNGMAIALDAAMTMLMERSGADRDEFLAEVRQRSQAVMASAQQKVVEQNQARSIILN